jgi:hypothetical protein
LQRVVPVGDPWTIGHSRRPVFASSIFESKLQFSLKQLASCSELGNEVVTNHPVFISSKKLRKASDADESDRPPRLVFATGFEPSFKRASDNFGSSGESRETAINQD